MRRSVRAGTIELRDIQMSTASLRLQEMFHEVVSRQAWLHAY